MRLCLGAWSCGVVEFVKRAEWYKRRDNAVHAYHGVGALLAYFAWGYKNNGVFQPLLPRACVFFWVGERAGETTVLVCMFLARTLHTLLCVL